MIGRRPAPVPAKPRPAARPTPARPSDPTRPARPEAPGHPGIGEVALPEAQERREPVVAVRAGPPALAVEGRAPGDGPRRAGQLDCFFAPTVAPLNRVALPARLMTTSFIASWSVSAPGPFMPPPLPRASSAAA